MRPGTAGLNLSVARIDRELSGRNWFLLFLVITSLGCTWARPVAYPIAPGLSASFPPSQLLVSEDYAKMFCTVLRREFDADWGPCNDYVRMATAHPPGNLDELPTDWTVLRLGGFGAQCMATTAETFADVAAHLETMHGIKSPHVKLGAFDSSEQNAVRIRDFVQGRPSSEKFIILAHSKGAADAMVALASYPAELGRVEGLITIAGAVGGSWLVDRLQRLNQQVLSHLSLPTCLPRTTRNNAIDSMRRTNRQKFLASHEHLLIPSFSISAVSTRKTTSKILLPLWDRVAPYAQEQDSHLVERETVVPGGIFLGRAKGDHWAVAMPFNPNPKVTKDALTWINHNKYPRPALAEAALRVALRRLTATRASD